MNISHEVLPGYGRFGHYDFFIKTDMQLNIKKRNTDIRCASLYADGKRIRSLISQASQEEEFFLGDAIQAFQSWKKVFSLHQLRNILNCTG
jgi:hypothetical protein